MIIRLAESGLVPDFLVRGGIRLLLGKRLAQEQQQQADPEALLRTLSQGPIAVPHAKASTPATRATEVTVAQAVGRRKEGERE